MRRDMYPAALGVVLPQPLATVALGERRLAVDEHLGGQQTFGPAQA